MFNEICNLSWNEVYTLSQDNEWGKFIRFINCYIYLIQQAHNGRRSNDTENIIVKMSTSLQMYKFLTYLKEEAINAIKEQMIEVGMLYDANMLDDLIQLYADFYAGNKMPVLDIVRAIDEYAKRNLINLTTLANANQILRRFEAMQKTNK